MSAGGDEFILIELFRACAREHPRVPLGIGDDTAVVRFPAPADCLFAADMLMDGVHFRLSGMSPRLIGRKALAVNLSDIAAMAGRPLAAVVSLALPRDAGTGLALELQNGLQQLADEFDTALVGGDTNVWDGPLVINVAVLGETTGPGPVLRSGAQPGDWILASGEFGGSLVSGHHLTFQPLVREAIALHERAGLHAMIDVSDGLAADLYHILDESRVGALLYERAIPISDWARDATGGRTPLDRALSDGEDFQLLLTVTPDDAAQLLRRPPLDVPLSHIGEITPGPGCEMQDSQGHKTTLPRMGWEHRFGEGK